MRWATLHGCVHRAAQWKPRAGASRGRAPPHGRSESLTGAQRTELDRVAVGLPDPVPAVARSLSSPLVRATPPALSYTELAAQVNRAACSGDGTPTTGDASPHRRRRSCLLWVGDRRPRATPGSSCARRRARDRDDAVRLPRARRRTPADLRVGAPGTTGPRGSSRGVFAGLSHGWWKGKHNRHHAAPNQEGRDPDIGPGAIAFTREIADARGPGFPVWFIRRQGWLFFPLLTLEGFNLHDASVRHVLADRSAPHRRWRCARRPPVWRRTLSCCWCCCRRAWPPPSSSCSWPCSACVSVARSRRATKACRSCPGRDRLPATAGADVAQRPRRLPSTIAMGGLNYQIEHHLFPSMPRPNLRLRQPDRPRLLRRATT